MYVCMYVYIYVCACTSSNVCTYNMCVCMHIYITCADHILKDAHALSHSFTYLQHPSVLKTLIPKLLVCVCTAHTVVPASGTVCGAYMQYVCKLMRFIFQSC